MGFLRQGQGSGPFQGQRPLRQLLQSGQPVLPGPIQRRREFRVLLQSIVDGKGERMPSTPLTPRQQETAQNFRKMNVQWPQYAQEHPNTIFRAPKDRPLIINRMHAAVDNENLRGGGNRGNSPILPRTRQPIIARQAPSPYRRG